MSCAPAQVLIEVHFGRDDGNGNVYPTAVSAKNLSQMSLLFAHLANLGYAIFYRCDNFVSNIGCCSEFSLLRVEEGHTHVT